MSESKDKKEDNTLAETLADTVLSESAGALVDVAVEIIDGTAKAGSELTDKLEQSTEAIAEAAGKAVADAAGAAIEAAGTVVKGAGEVATSAADVAADVASGIDVNL